MVAQQENSDTFMASIQINNTDIMEVLARKYVAHMKISGTEISNPFINNRFSRADQNLSEED